VHALGNEHEATWWVSLPAFDTVCPTITCPQYQPRPQQRDNSKVTVFESIASVPSSGVNLITHCLRMLIFNGALTGAAPGGRTDRFLLVCQRTCHENSEHLSDVLQPPRLNRGFELIVLNTLMFVALMILPGFPSFYRKHLISSHDHRNQKRAKEDCC